jgi:hypothetical protein
MHDRNFEKLERTLSSFFNIVNINEKHRRMAKGGHGLPNTSTPCGQAIPETAILGMAHPQGGQSAGSLRPSFTPLDTPRRMPMMKSTTLMTNHK